MESLDVSGGGVMSDPKEQSEKEEGKEGRTPAKKPPGYRKFEKLLKQVVNAPPLRRVPKD
jgi:hypothetical protein